MAAISAIGPMPPPVEDVLATYGTEVLAVLTFSSRDQVALTDQFMR